jgi:hypothetical protein
MVMTRERYKLQQRNQNNIRRVNTLMERESRTLFSLLSDPTQAQMGGFLRKTVPGLVDKYGKVNAAIAVQYYDAQRAEYESRKGSSRNAVSRGQRFANARLQSAVYVAKLPKFDVLKKAEPVIGYGMSLFQKNGFNGLELEITNAMTRAIASYNRDTILYNSAIDRDVVGVQRVAQSGACDFCQTVAFDSYGSVRVSSYAIEFHNHCQCTIETIFEGDTAYRPDYYDQFPYGGQTGYATDTSSLKEEYGAGFVSQ